jgi:hypothetical protein
MVPCGPCPPLFKAEDSRIQIMEKTPEMKFRLRKHYEGDTGHAPDGVWVLFSRPEGGYAWPMRLAEYHSPTRAPDYWSWFEELGTSAEVTRAQAQRVATAAGRDLVYGGDCELVTWVPVDGIAVRVAEELDARAAEEGQAGEDVYRSLRCDGTIGGLVDRFGRGVEPENLAYAERLVRRRLDDIFGYRR